ncbi:protein of unknown function (plasmid) [Cupriavidus taiwanensis]|uniref:Uncharacterized protein n=1 Tax=Cupriavidus taiwanensis TaxID=164546 RepID=A0A7Z7NPM2_9BURK|nr:protein of unknown function [Cupriavidus taiwanensis]SOZ11535.1 protein of unknown function [Cupriavidus taiwanensis]SOZ42890.1 protein of unknown function [Cupriavidus taiwanensis]SPC22137.1 protein of unknown function [Cupriavidus taiwanensis]SPD53640.1 protein of unknown function [Cupriavidus taiwanensis]
MGCAVGAHGSHEAVDRADCVRVPEAAPLSCLGASNVSEPGGAAQTGCAAAAAAVRRKCGARHTMAVSA